LGFLERGAFAMGMNATQMIAQYWDFFRRNNPMEQLVIDVRQAFNHLKTLGSRRKLQKYNCLLELERMEKIQALLEQSTPYDPTGVKLDRPF
jgi:hypothetical protein